MGILYLYRLGSFGLATLAAIIVLALCAKTQTAAQALNSKIIDEIGKQYGLTFHFDTYDKLGIAAGALTLITVPIMIFLDFWSHGARVTIIFELVWLTILLLAFVATGSLAIKENTTFLGSNSDLTSCDELTGLGWPQGTTICQEAKPIGVLAYIAAGLLFLYVVGLLIFSLTKNGSRPVWGTSVKEAEDS